MNLIALEFTLFRKPFDKFNGTGIKNLGLVEVANVAAVADDFELGVKMRFNQIAHHRQKHVITVAH